MDTEKQAGEVTRHPAVAFTLSKGHAIGIIVAAALIYGGYAVYKRFQVMQANDNYLNSKVNSLTGFVMDAFPSQVEAYNQKVATKPAPAPETPAAPAK